MLGRRVPATFIGALSALVLIAAFVAPASAASARPTVILDTSMSGTTATITVEVNRAPHQIASCDYVLDSAPGVSCGTARASGWKASSYTLRLTDQTVGSHIVTVTVVLTDGGSASRAATFKISDNDTDGDGVPDATDNCPTIANANQANHYGSAKGDACEDTDADGTLDVDEANICVSVDGVVILSPADSTANCDSDQSTGSTPNVAIADGDGSSASAYGGDGNTASAIGVGDVARASAGSANTAIARGTDSSAAAYSGNGNDASASGDSAIAAAHGGNDNTASASSDGALAFAFNGNGNTATASGAAALASAHDGNGNTAIADGDHAVAEASAPAGCTITNGTCP